jgi:hypothetical protein
VKFEVRPSILENSSVHPWMGVYSGLKIPPTEQSSPLGAKSSPRGKLHLWGQTYSVKNWPQNNKLQASLSRFSPPGVDVMVTIFCDFSQFSAKKLAFSQIPMLRSFFSNFTFLLSQKRQLFR